MSPGDALAAREAASENVALQYRKRIGASKHGMRDNLQNQLWRRGEPRAWRRRVPLSNNQKST